MLLGEKLCELENVQNFVEGAQKVVAEMRICCSLQHQGGGGGGEGGHDG